MMDSETTDLEVRLTSIITKLLVFLIYIQSICTLKIQVDSRNLDGQSEFFQLKSLTIPETR